MKIRGKNYGRIKQICAFILVALLTLSVMPASVFGGTKTRTVTVSHFPINGGTTTPVTYKSTKIVYADDGVPNQSFAAIANPGYVFYYWMASGEGVRRNYYDYAVQLDCTSVYDVRAFFIRSNCTGVIATSDNSDMGTVSGTRYWQKSLDGTNVTISASPRDAKLYEFDYWEKNGVRMDYMPAACEVTMPGIDLSNYDPSNGEVKNSQDKYVAHFKSKGAEHGFRAVVNNPSYGSVTGGSFTPYSTWLTQGSVSATAQPAEGYKFVKWTDSSGTLVSTNATLNLGYPSLTDEQKKSDLVYTAVFEPDNPIGIKAESRIDSKTGTVGGGTVNPTYVNWTSGNKNQSISFTATPDHDYKFKEWIMPSGVTTSGSTTNPSISVVMPNSKPASEIEIVAVFEKDSQYEVYTEVAEETSSGLNTGVGGTVTPAMIKPDASNTTEASLTANPADGYEFVRWEIATEGAGASAVTFVTDKTKPTVTVSVPSETVFDSTIKTDVDIRAVFKKNNDVGVWAFAREGGEVNPLYIGWTTENRGTSFTLTATPNKGYEFDHWEYYDANYDLEIKDYSKAATISEIMPKEKMEYSVYYYAVFKKNSENAKNKEIHVEGKETSITSESFLNKWKVWISPALKYVRSTIQTMAGQRTAGDAANLEANKASSNAGASEAASLKNKIEIDNNMKHSQSVDNPVILEDGGFNVMEVSGLKAVFIEGMGCKTEDEAKEAVSEKYGKLYGSSAVLCGEIYFEDEKGNRISPSSNNEDGDATVVMTGIDTSNADMWMLLYEDLSGNLFTITPIKDTDSVIRFTLPDKSGGRINLLSVRYK